MHIIYIVVDVEDGGLLGAFTTKALAMASRELTVSTLAEPTRSEQLVAMAVLPLRVMDVVDHL